MLFTLLCIVRALIIDGSIRLLLLLLLLLQHGNVVVYPLFQRHLQLSIRSVQMFGQ